MILSSQGSSNIGREFFRWKFQSLALLGVKKDVIPQESAILSGKVKFLSCFGPNHFKFSRKTISYDCTAKGFELPRPKM